MAGYTKLFNSILASTVWREDNETRIVWITLLAMADKNGVADGSVPGLADFARLPVAAVRVSLEKLSSPDPDSRSKDFEGRRIEAVDGGWLLLNHAKYRAKMGADERREYNRTRQQRYRAVAKGSRLSQSVSGSGTSHYKAEADTEADATPEAERAAIINCLNNLRAGYCFNRQFKHYFDCFGYSSNNYSFN